MSTATQTQGETVGTGRDRLQERTFCPSFGVLVRIWFGFLVGFSDFVSASFLLPKRSPKQEKPLLQPHGVRWATSFLLTAH